MSPTTSTIAEDLELLGILAMQFRVTTIDDDRREIAADYALTVDRLILSGDWLVMPPLEHLLPDAWMPTAFTEYWLRRTISGSQQR